MNNSFQEGRIFKITSGESQERVYVHVQKISLTGIRNNIRSIVSNASQITFFGGIQTDIAFSSPHYFKMKFFQIVLYNRKLQYASTSFDCP